MPKNSRSSLKNDIFSQLPNEQVFDEMTIESLITCFEMVEKLSTEKKSSLVIFDDVQQFLKGECQDLVLHMVNNRRHNRLSIFILAQSYKKIPKMVRDAFSDLFLFKLSKEDYEEIFRELVTLPIEIWHLLLQNYFNELKAEVHSFLYISTKHQKYFINWNELVLDNDTNEQDEIGKSSFERKGI
jgi:hypothetical protein